MHRHLGIPGFRRTTSPSVRRSRNTAPWSGNRSKMSEADLGFLINNSKISKNSIKEVGRQC